MTDIDNAKNRLQEYCQQRYLLLPIYSTLERIGFDHSPMFQVEVLVDGMIFIGDWASRKREAEKSAAMKALISIHKPPSLPPKTIRIDEIKDSCIYLENMNLSIEEPQTIESMECD